MLAKGQCKVFVYDSSCEPLHAEVDVDVFDEGEGFENIGGGTTRPIRGELPYGVIISLRLKPASISVVITDTALRYAPNTYPNLNGSVSSRLDLTLYELPSEPGNFGEGGPAPHIESGDRRFTQIGNLYRQIQRQEHWSSEAKKGVRDLLGMYAGFVLKFKAPEDRLLVIANRCEKALERIGIARELIATVREPIRAAIAHQ